MALTPEEQIELQELEREATARVHPAPMVQQQISGLSQEEQEELRGLEQEVQSRQQSQQDERGLMSKVISGVGEVADMLAAPARSSLMALAKGENPITAFGGQFLESSSKAPTGKDIAIEVGISKKPLIADVKPQYLMGMPDDMMIIPGGAQLLESIKDETIDLPSPAGAVGLGIDVAVDPLAFIPFGKIIKGIRGMSKGAAKVALKGSAKAADIAIGTEKISKTGEVIGKSIDDVKRIMSETFKPKIAKDFDKLKDIATRNNIDIDILPESIEFGKESFISRASRQKAEMGGKGLEDFEKAIEQTSTAFDNKVRKISGTGDILDKAGAGSLIRDSYDRGVKRFFDSMDVTHNKIIIDNPGLKLSDNAMAALESKLKGVERFAKGRIKRGADPVFVSQGKRLLRNIDNIRNTDGSYKQVVEALREIGEVSFSSKNIMATIPADTKKMREIYKSINESLEASVRSGIGDDTADMLVLNNSMMSDFFGDKSVLKKIGDKNLADESLFKTLIINGDSKKIDALKNIISPEDFKQIKAAFLGEMGAVNQPGNLLFRTTHNNLKRKASVVSKLLDEKEIVEISEILDFGDRLGIPVLSTSGTGASSSISGIAKKIGGVITNDLLIENLKQLARGERQLEKINKLASAVSKPEARKLIKSAGLPKRIEKAALSRVRFIDFGPRKAILKASQIKRVQEVEGERKNKGKRLESLNNKRGLEGLMSI